MCLSRENIWHSKDLQKSSEDISSNFHKVAVER